MAKDTLGDWPMHEGLVRDLLRRFVAERKIDPGHLRDRASLALIDAEEAAKLPPGSRERADALAELLDVQRELLEALSST